MAHVKLSKKDVFGNDNVVWAHDEYNDYRINRSGWIQIYAQTGEYNDAMQFDRIELNNKTITYNFIKDNQIILSLKDGINDRSYIQ